ncbi:anti-sigma factor antagonist [Deferribacter desulfuricans SSM1]|uniref:Anti-sigma factor antagonist n=1 Tax=Deferribacter desulfuricans (strain DSM 14783 / JCM 11476 / NBRC 101012 / SSM1) TaxID=639282 RepID=D3PBF0_DEFDS|nr:STAS domain-containing protein [Deferribacter desulfuricans]BAI79923.1 anti-sigma factor antagonist [Deferribacter desulfuricans SSM1]
MDVKDVNGKKVVYLSGEINAQTGQSMKEEVLKLFESTDTVVLSFKGVVYMNSSGLREIIDLYKKTNKNKKNLRLCELSNDLKEMFSFTGLDKVFKIFATENEALR